MSNAVIIGVTGQTGAGKSTFVDFLVQGGIKCIDADAVARQAVEVGSPCLEQLKAEFGNEIINEDGSLNRRALGAAAFADSNRTAVLNRITHPHILRLMNKQADELVQEGEQYILFDAPQLFEAGADSLCGYTVAILADFDTKLARIMSRDGLNRQQAQARLSAAHDNAFFEQRCDEVFYNNGCENELCEYAQGFLNRIKAGELSNH